MMCIAEKPMLSFTNICTKSFIQNWAYIFLQCKKTSKIQKNKNCLAKCCFKFELPPLVNFTYILQIAFPPISFCQKILKTNCKWRELLRKTLSFKNDVCKMLVKLIPLWQFGSLGAEGEAANSQSLFRIRKMSSSPSSLTLKIYLLKIYFIDN